MYHLLRARAHVGLRFMTVLMAGVIVIPSGLIVLMAGNGGGPAGPGDVGYIPPLPMAGYGSMAPGTLPHYFGPYGNWANSPVPTGSVTALALIGGGSGYTNPTVSIVDAWGTGSGATASATVIDGVIMGLTLTNGGSKYSAPVVVFSDATGSGASATVDIGGTLSGGIHKFVDSLPGLTPAGANNLGNYIPVAVADTTTFPGCDYYEIALVRFTQKFHTDLPPTLLQGYVQLETGSNYAVSKHVALKNPDGTAIKLANGTRAMAVDNPLYLGPMIVSQRDRPVRVTFHNLLPTGTGGDLFLPVDTSVMGAGMGPLDMVGMPGMKENYTQNRATLHLHGGATPWISDGTPEQWTTPAGETTLYPKGVSVQYVPDMWFVKGAVVSNTVGKVTPPVAGAVNSPGNGSLTFYYTNNQSARLMFYHDHSFGITRLNVYSGEVGPYLLTDSVEKELIAMGLLPNLGGAYEFGIPLVIQDKAFVDASTIAYQDPTWAWGSTPATGPHTGDLWMPHVYMPNQNPYDPSGGNAFGRWDYGPWFFPPTTDILQPPKANPYYDPVHAPWEPPVIPDVPYVSMAMEAFVDTPVVNGVAYPYLDVNPTTYRFRILNGANDRMFNLQFFVADPSVVTPDGRVNTEVNMVDAVATPGFPALWPVDGRAGGVPNPADVGPDFIQIANEGGFLPAPAIIPAQPVTWNYNQRTFHFGDVQDHSLLLGSAERADVIVDFSQFAGKTLILYNDAPAPLPAYDLRNDYYTGDGDNTDSGGAPNTQPGFGPNTRTIMQIRVAAANPSAPYDVNALKAAFASTPQKAGVFARDQEPIIVPQETYDSAYGQTFPTTQYAGIADYSMTFKNLEGTSVSVDFQAKGIHEEMGGAYNAVDGRSSAILGLEIPFANAVGQQFIGFPYLGPPVEILDDATMVRSAVTGDGTQIWKITHNGVDTHTIHWHLFSVQLINRVAWDNTMIYPDANELGWKETLRVNPLMDTIVALRPVTPSLPFEVPDNTREIDTTMPDGASLLGTGGGWMDTAGNPITMNNHKVNFGWEYVYHCHILGHEEMDMMHGVVLAVPPVAPSNFAVTVGPNRHDLRWTDNSITEQRFFVQRATSSTGPWTTLSTIATTTAATKGTTYSYRDNLKPKDTTIYYYRVLANKVVGDTQVPSTGVAFPTTSANSTPPYIIKVSGTTVTKIAVTQTPYSLPVGTTFGFTQVETKLKTLPSYTPPGGPYTAHAPIRIDSNADFNAAHGVSAGDGTAGNPWVIQGMDIYGTEFSYCIYVGNTTDYFVIKNNYLHGASDGTFDWNYRPDSAVVLNNVQNGLVYNNVLYSNGWAGVFSKGSKSFTVQGNTISCSNYGVYLSSTSSASILSNTIAGNTVGLWMDPSSSNTVDGNTVTNGTLGIALVSSSGNTLTNNNVLSNDRGFFLTGTSTNTLHHNDVMNNGAQAYDDGTDTWDSGTVGNYWSDYNGTDANHDGIGDSAYTKATGQGITGGANKDRYPLMLASDHVAPTASVDTIVPYWHATSPVTIGVTATDMLSGVRDVTLAYSHSSDNVTFGAWANFLTLFAPPWHFSFTFPGGEGYYQFRANASDKAGNLGTQPSTAQAMCGYDATSATSSVDALSPSWNSALAMPVSATAADALSGLGSVALYYAHSADNVTWAAVSGYTLYSRLLAGPWSWSFTFPDGTGYYRFYSVAVDNAGNVEGLPSVPDAGMSNLFMVLDHVKVLPSTIEMIVSNSAQFTAQALDAYNNLMPGQAFTWTASIGSITSTGLFTAPAAANVTGYVNATTGGKTGSATVSVINAPTLVYILITPGTVNVTAGASQAFTATGYNQYNGTVPGLTFTWSANIGSMAGATLTAQKTAGAAGYVKATVGVVSGYAWVNIVPGALSSIYVKPTNQTVLAGSQYQYEAFGKDAYNNTIPGVTFAWTTTVGNITSAGLLTARLTNATGYVNATNGTFTGSVPVKVTTVQFHMVAGNHGTMGDAAAPGSKDPATDRDDRRCIGDAPTFDRTADFGTVYVSTPTARASVGPRDV